MIGHPFSIALAQGEQCGRARRELEVSEPATIICSFNIRTLVRMPSAEGGSQERACRLRRAAMATVSPCSNMKHRKLRLFVAQRYHRLNSSGPARRHYRGYHRSHRQQHRGRGQHDRIPWLDTK